MKADQIKDGQTVRIVEPSHLSEFVGLEGVYRSVVGGGSFVITPTKVPATSQSFNLGEESALTKQFYTFELVYPTSAQQRLADLRKELEQAEVEVKREEETDASQMPVGTYVTFLIGTSDGGSSIKRVIAIKQAENDWSVVFAHNSDVTPGKGRDTDQGITKSLRRVERKAEVYRL